MVLSRKIEKILRVCILSVTISGVTESLAGASTLPLALASQDGVRLYPTKKMFFISGNKPTPCLRAAYFFLFPCLHVTYIKNALRINCNNFICHFLP